jgi:hypothetical protein
VSAEAFLRDLEAKPTTLRALADALTSGDPWAGLEPRTDVALLTEVLVAELVAARWWLAQDGGRG